MSAPDCPRDEAGFCRIALLGGCPGTEDGVECEINARIASGKISAREALFQAADCSRKALRK